MSAHATSANSMTAYPAITELVPHTAPILAIDELAILELSLDYRDETADPPVSLPIDEFDLTVRNLRSPRRGSRVLDREAKHEGRGGRAGSPAPRW